jgi:hypothetical protein
MTSNKGQGLALGRRHRPDRGAGRAAHDCARDRRANRRSDHSTRSGTNRAARQGPIDRPVAAGGRKQSKAGDGKGNF